MEEWKPSAIYYYYYYYENDGGCGGSNNLGLKVKLSLSTT
jgi:hypothetical protein